MNQFKNFNLIREEIMKRVPSEVSVFVSLSINTLKPAESELYYYYRFLLSENGEKREKALPKKHFQNTTDLYKQVLSDFFKEKQLVFYKDDIKQISHSTDAYLGMCLRNRKNEQLNLYYSSNALEAYEEMREFICNRKLNDFYQYGVYPITKKLVERMVFYPTEDDRSSVLYIRDNEEYDNYHLRIRKQFGYYYQKYGNGFDETDLKSICFLIRLFINTNLEFCPKYYYVQSTQFSRENLIIVCTNGIFIEIPDRDLIDAIEKARIIDDLWLLMHGLIKEMPTQEESLENKDYLRSLRKNYLDKNVK